MAKSVGLEPPPWLKSSGGAGGGGGKGGVCDVGRGGGARGGRGGDDRRVGVWRKVTGNAIDVCASQSLGRTTICWGTGLDIVGVNLGLLMRYMSAA